MDKIAFFCASSGFECPRVGWGSTRTLHRAMLFPHVKLILARCNQSNITTWEYFVSNVSPGCSVPGVTENVCGQKMCTSGPDGYTCGKRTMPSREAYSKHYQAQDMPLTSAGSPRRWLESLADWSWPQTPAARFRLRFRLIPTITMLP